ncbi:MAG TPA: hypothetical protein VEC09_07990, partial [Actinomycetota bacterium]|nr:hypothetical protein [Actinomycetota bacterium]
MAALATESALAYLQASTVRGHLAEGRDDLIDARGALLAGDAEAAADAFRDAGAAFDAASGAARGLIARLFTPLPVLGRTPDAMAAIADAGGRVADAGVT